MLRMLAMDVEELLRMPIGAVAMGVTGLTPGLVLRQGAQRQHAFIYMPAGPMLRGNVREQVLGSGSDTWKWDERRAGKINKAQWRSKAALRAAMACVGTASTMTGIAGGDGPDAASASSIPPWIQTTSRMATRCGPPHCQHGLGRPDTERNYCRAPRSNAITVIAMTLDQRHHSPRRHVAPMPASIAPSGLDDFDAFASRKVLTM
jgi:dihydroxy-acid dehydratase